ncbi:PREDICTED: dihydroxyacetone phosphate acyltransferase [Nicrophorus vespilloides]|uniref:Dihydroxyacetone phosphate acyltransferase n=1 Tax=Nicrophorus vespilloides TaxID=110193 RepID=A0ABM1MG71_NICVS|nr:PREDICTED: dihydroxyacetone phosphate acyltransferase [Nicrophorus vespilloides]
MIRSALAFRDILEDRRNECSNFLWVSRVLSPYAPCKEYSKIGPKQHKMLVLKSRKIQDLIDEISFKSELPPKDVERRVKIILDEIGFNKHTSTIRWLGLFLTKVCCRVCRGIYFNTDGIDQLRRHMDGGIPVIYVPSHRSYADFILMSYLLFTLNIEIPAIAAGMDFHGMKGMGTVLRNTGAFFMRRSYNDDNLYWDTFRQYVHQLVTKNSAGIEFFIEGTRSRSCKSLPPKFGLLTMILRAFLTGEVPDILFVPINISYDRVMEERLFAYELLGVPKPKESTSGFFKSLSMVNEKYGSIYIDVGSPISVKDFFGSRLDKTKNHLIPQHLQILGPYEKKEISSFAEHIVNAQQHLTVLSAFNLIATVLNNNLLMRKNILRLDELVTDVMWIRNILDKFGALSNLKYPRENIMDALDVHKNLVQMDDESNITLVQDSVILADGTKFKAHALSDATMTLAVPFVMLQIYVNPVLYYTINQSILVTIIKNYETHLVSKDRLYDDYVFLRSLMSNEFVLFEYNNKKDFWKSLESCVDLEAISKLDETTYGIGKNEKIQDLFANLLMPFIQTYYLVCIVINNVNIDSCPEKRILRDSQERIERIANSKPNQFVHPYTLNLDSIGHCLSILVKMNILYRERVKGEMMYNTKPNVMLVNMIRNMEKYVPLKEDLQLTSFKNKL